MNPPVDRLPNWAGPFIDRAIEVTRADPRLLGLMLAGSATTGTMDEYSDLDLVMVCLPEHHAGLLREAPQLAARLGPLLASFTGEHVGEPRLLITLYGPPPVHVDLKIVTEADLDQRVEDGVILWQRGASVSAGLSRVDAAWPQPDPQWIEDRFWIWVHYAVAKIGRGELFECLDVLAFLRGTVFGPLIAVANGHRSQGVRRIERIAPDAVAPLAATLGEHTATGCLAAVRAAVDLYRDLRRQTAGVTRRAAAEDASVAYLAEVTTRIGG